MWTFLRSAQSDRSPSYSPYRNNAIKFFSEWNSIESTEPIEFVEDNSNNFPFLNY